MSLIERFHDAMNWLVALAMGIAGGATWVVMRLWKWIGDRAVKQRDRETNEAAVENLRDRVGKLESSNQEARLLLNEMHTDLKWIKQKMEHPQ